MNHSVTLKLVHLPATANGEDDFTDFFEVLETINTSSMSFARYQMSALVHRVTANFRDRVLMSLHSRQVVDSLMGPSELVHTSVP